jgi:hypothetical protein
MHTRDESPDQTLSCRVSRQGRVEGRLRNLQLDASGYENVNVAVATLGSGLIWANMLRAFQLGKARRLIRDGGASVT